MQDFRKLRVWQDAIELAAAVYEVTSRLPNAERYGLRAQTRSSAISVSSNIAEGCGRPTRKDMARFLGIAIGSICELESQIYVIARLDLLDEASTESLVVKTDRCKRQLINLYRRVLAVSDTYHLP
ncbi:MAG TPA: four helix bundle protein, partial [Acidimicrobiia bacterium]|nr:four helix bundle protein [Acidimicrobiia bacterium]